MGRAYFKNLPTLEKKLRALREKTRENVEKKMAAIAQMVVDKMKSRAEWAHVRESIGWTFGNSPLYSIKVAQAKAGDLKITIYAGNEKVRDATWLEFGTAPHDVGGKKRDHISHPGTAARPFFFSTWRLEKKVVRKMLREALREVIREVVVS